MPLPNVPEPPHPSSNYADQSGRPSQGHFDYLKGLQRWSDGTKDAVDTLQNDVTTIFANLETINEEIDAINDNAAFVPETREALRTTIVPATVTHLHMAGFYTVGDGGEGFYKRIFPITIPVGTYYVQSADGAWWIYAPSDRFNVKAIGAKGDGTQDESQFFEDIIQLANGRKIYAPGGGAGYRFDRPLTSYAGPINIEGDGNGQTTSPGVTYTTLCTTFRLNFASGYLFTVDSAAPMVFRDILFIADGVTMSGGAALYFTCSTGGLGCSPSIYGCAFTLVYVGIQIDKVSGPDISQRNVFDNCIHAAIYLTTSGGFEGGGGNIAGNHIIGYSLPTTYGIYSEVGYSKINNNDIVGCVIGILLNVSTGAGAFEIVQNQLEEQTTYGIYLARSGSGVAAMPQIKNNEFSNLTQTAIVAHIYIADSAAADWIDSISITGNILRSIMDTGGYYIRCLSGTGITCDMNEITHLGGGNPTAISITGAAVKAPAYCRINRFGGAGTIGTRYDTSAAVVVHDTSLAFATLPAACANGSMFFVTDGKATNIAGGNYTLTNGGNGCLSVRCNGVHTVGGVA